MLRLMLRLRRLLMMQGSSRIKLRHGDCDSLLGSQGGIPQSGSSAGLVGDRLRRSLRLLSSLGGKGGWERNHRQDLCWATALGPSWDVDGLSGRGGSLVGQRGSRGLDLFHRGLRLQGRSGCSRRSGLLGSLCQSLGLGSRRSLLTGGHGLLVGSRSNRDRLLIRTLVTRGLVCRLATLTRRARRVLSCGASRSTGSAGSARSARSTRGTTGAGRELVGVPRAVAHRGKFLTRREPARRRVRHAAKRTRRRARSRTSSAAPAAHVRGIVAKTRTTWRTLLILRTRVSYAALRAMRPSRAEGAGGAISGTRASLRRGSLANAPPDD